MPTPSQQSSTTDSSRLALTRAGAIGALLLLEYGLLSFRFDALHMLEHSGALSLLGHLGNLAPLVVVVATAVLLLDGATLRAELGRALMQHTSTRQPALFIALNLLLFGGFAWLTARVFETPKQASPVGSGWLLLWAGLGAGTVLSLLGAAMPLRAVLPLLRRLGRALGAGSLVGVVAWGAGLLSARMWESMSGATLFLVLRLLAPLRDDLVHDPVAKIVGAEDFYVIVAPECSGFEGIGLIVVFLGIYLWSARRNLRFPQALLLFPVGMLAVWLGNGVRIAALIGVGLWISPDVALGGFHSKAGWLFFCGVALGLVALTRRSNFLSTEPQDNTERSDTWNPTATYLMPLLALLATVLVTGLFVAEFDYLYPVRVVSVAAGLYLYRGGLPRPSWPPSWEAPLVGLLVFGLWLWLVPATPETGSQLQERVAQLPGWLSALWVGGRIVGSVITVPIAEELAFRGYLLRRLIDPEFVDVPKTRWTPLSLIGSSVAFGIMHQAWLPGIVAGAAYALCMHRRGRLSDAIVAHAVTNGLIAGAVLGTGRWYLWG